MTRGILIGLILGLLFSIAYDEVILKPKFEKQIRILKEEISLKTIRLDASRQIRFSIEQELQNLREQVKEG